MVKTAGFKLLILVRDAMKLVLLTISFLIITNRVYAQEDTIPDVTIKEVLIHENRLQIPLSQKPSSLVVIGPERIGKLPVQSVGELLHHVAGVDIRERGSNGIQNDVSIRGSSFDQVLILVNGIRMSDPQTGHHSLNLPVDLSCVDHIEVFKGPSARVFGQNAFAGAINIITKIPSQEFIRFNALAGDFGLYGGNISASFSGRSVKNYLSLSHNRSSGYKYNTDFKVSDIFYQSDIPTRYGNINLLSWLSDRKFGANGFYSSPDYQDQYEEVQTSLVALSFNPEIKNRMVKLSNRIYWRRNRDEYIFIRSDPSYYRNLHTNNIVGMDVNLSFANNLGVTGLGIDMSIPWITSNRLGTRNRKEATLFAEHRITLMKGDLNITPGIQINIFSGFENNILPGIDIGYFISPKFMTFINSGYTYRVPTYTDLYYEDPVNTSNPDLQPEYAFSNEAGFKTVKVTGVTGEISYFIRRNYNLIDRSKEDINDKWKPDNIGEVRMDGIDLNLNIQPGELTGNPDFIIQRFDLGYTYINSKVMGSLPPFSKFALENLKNQIVMAFELKYFRNFYQTLNFRYINRVNMDDYSLADTRIGWHSQKLSCYIDITNLFNVEYRETNFVTLPGRWIKAGVTYTINLKR